MLIVSWENQTNLEIKHLSFAKWFDTYLKNLAKSAPNIKNSKFYILKCMSTQILNVFKLLIYKVWWAHWGIQ